ncbi:hypothetical protein [Rhizobium sp. YK2]|uniref:hypothetical protein n=1 Tax=Rhizobium sp. YK2 TaxID=1860096 RepID=UPI00084CDED7|nr:hypothetical protein [Rhizobium sp. YK2]OEC94405.1 hypothetical protein A9Z06_33415 [Rhizobium sp. YK2]
MSKPIQSAGEAMPAPCASDILADYSRLLTLIEISSEMVSDLNAEEMPFAQRALLFNAQNIANVVSEYAGRLDKDLDLYMSRPGT